MTNPQNPEPFGPAQNVRSSSHAYFAIFIAGIVVGTFSRDENIPYIALALFLLIPLLHLIRPHLARNRMAKIFGKILIERFSINGRNFDHLDGQDLQPVLKRIVRTDTLQYSAMALCFHNNHGWITLEASFPVLLPLQPGTRISVGIVPDNVAMEIIKAERPDLVGKYFSN